MSPRTGRPLDSDSKREDSVRIRLSNGELEMLDECARKTKTTRSYVVREGIKLVKAEIDKKK